MKKHLKISKSLHPLAFSVYAIVVILFLVAVLPMQKTAFQSFFASVTEIQIISEVNPSRQSANLLPLETNQKLTQAAQLKAEDMVERGYFSHVGPDGESPWSWLNKVDYKYALAGENLAKNFYDSELLVSAWLRSPSHAKNILNGYYTDIGIGVASGEVEGKDTTMVVMFVGREVTPAIQTLSNLPENPPPVPQEPKPAPEPITNVSFVPPEELATIITVEEEVLEKERSLVLALNQPLDFRFQDNNGQVTGFSAFVMNVLPNFLRLSLTTFFVLLSIFAVYIATKRKAKNIRFAFPRLVTLALLIIVLWI